MRRCQEKRYAVYNLTASCGLRTTRKEPRKKFFRTADVSSKCGSFPAAAAGPTVCRRFRSTAGSPWGAGQCLGKGGGGNPGVPGVCGGDGVVAGLVAGPSLLFAASGWPVVVCFLGCIYGCCAVAPELHGGLPDHELDARKKRPGAHRRSEVVHACKLARLGLLFTWCLLCALNALICLIS